jgi:hypothetical protein
MVLVGRRGEKRVVLWGNWFKTRLGLTALSAAFTTLAYVVLAQRWNPDAPLRGLCGGAGISLVLLVVSLLTPRKRLPILPRDH